MAYPLLAAVYQDMAIASGEYLKNVKQEIRSLPQSFSAFEYVRHFTFSSLEVKAS